MTARDVARAAGVSQATVSYVLNDTPGQKIPEATRRRVLRAVRDLGYTPSGAARALRRGQSDTVLLILPDWPLEPALASFVDRLSRELEQRGLSLMTRHEHPERPLSALWRETAPAAVVAPAPLEEGKVEEMRAAGVHVVAPSSGAPGETELTGAALQRLIGTLQVQHLAATGHRHLGCTVPTDPRVELFGRLRLDGVRTACAELGLAGPAVVGLDLDAASAASAVRRWRAREPRVTAVCAYNDSHAFALLAGMRTLGLAAPTDLAVIGVDNVPLAPFAHPPLTTVDMRQDVLAADVARVVAAGATGAAGPAGEEAAPAPRSEVVELVVRESA